MLLLRTVAHSKMSALVLVLLALLCARGETQQSPAVREFYIAAVEIGWDYIHVETDGGTTDSRKMPNNVQKFIKAVYREYTDSTYSVAKPRPAWAGIQGPVIHAKAGDRVVVHFKNLASQPYSISPVGITYSKLSEGAGYDDSTAGEEKLDDAVLPGGHYEYVWDINPKDGPTISDPECLTYSYSSQVDTVRDTNSGLIGVLLICKSSAFNEDGQRRRVEFVLLFAVFDETKTWYGEVGERRSRDRLRRGSIKQFHTINGYVNSTLPGLTMCQGRDHVFWHLIGLGTAPEIHSIQFQKHTLKVMLHRKFNVEMTPMTFITAEMKPTTVGQFLISCQIHAHKHAGMLAQFTVEDCPTPLPGPDVRNAQGEDYSMEDYGDYNYGGDLFNMLSFKPQPGLRSLNRNKFQTWQYFIAAEEVTWDYSPDHSPMDREDFPTSTHQLGYRYKKVVYVEYTDKTFTQKKHPEASLFGPLLKGEVNDQFHIVFRNKASRPFNIYPSGISNVSPLQKSTNEAEKNLRIMGVPPNGTYGYVWKLTWDDGPLEEDPQCLTQLYQSTVNPERDLASGLVGMLLICKNDAIDPAGQLVGPDKERRLIFAVMDENRSWYISENIQKNSQDPSKVNPADPTFYKSNIIYSVNGVMLNTRQLLVCQNDVTYWHMANIGPQSDFLSIYFTGNPFQRNNRYRFVLTLFPMTGETVSMETELLGEWEISAFDSTLKDRGMSIRYMVNPCDNVDLPLVDREEDEIDYGLNEYLDAKFPHWQRSLKPQNLTRMRPCKKPTSDPSATQSVNTTNSNSTDGDVTSGGEALCEVEDVPSGGIPLEVLKELDRQEEGVASSGQDGLVHERPRNVRRRREVEGDEREAEVGVVGDEGTGMGSGGETRANLTDARAEVVAWAGDGTYRTNETNEDAEDANGIFLGSGALVEKQNSTMEPTVALGLRLSVEPSNPIPLGPDQPTLEGVDLDGRNTNTSDNNMTTPEVAVRVDYDDYGLQMNDTFDLGGTDYVDLRSMGQYTFRNYYIAAEEITWDYGIKRPHQFIKPREMRRGMRKFLTEYKKVVYRAYRDEDFLQPVARGELQQHLGLMGPVVRAEINDLLTVTFKNKASRPYSFHLNGVYDRSQGAGIQSQASAASAGVPGEAVPPGEARVYKWKITRKQGPTDTEFACKAGAYYSTVNQERDLHSGLIGPLVVCKPGTLHRHQNLQPGIQEYSLLFHTFDETKSWYLEENLQKYCTPPCQANSQDMWFQIGNKFAAVNGFVAETLPGLLVAQYEPVRWHLLNVGGDGEYHAIQFHGLPFSIHTEQEHRMGIYNLYPGVFGTIEMQPPTVGTWLVECTVGEQQLAGMRAKLLVYSPRCILPLGMKSGRIEDSQITASDHVDNWEPSLARLDLSGSVNAWMGHTLRSWLQVDLLRPTLVHRVQTQGVRAFLTEHFVTHYSLSYSLDGETWLTYRGNNTRQTYGRRSLVTLNGNMDSSRVKENAMYPPIIARYVRIKPMNSQHYPALRLELLGCDLNSCSLPLIGERRFGDDSFKSSSFRSTWIHKWSPSRARLNQDGSDNAWRPQNNNPHEWLQVDLLKEMRITGVVTQGAWSMLKQMMVTEFSVTYSDDEHLWNTVMQEGTQMEKIFKGNSDPDEEALTLFDPPIFGRFIRIHPVGWINDIALRVEILGCDTQQRF